MSTPTEKLGLNLLPSSEWSTTKFGDYIEALCGSSATSDMNKIDTAVGSVQATLTELETVLSEI